MILGNWIIEISNNNKNYGLHRLIIKLEAAIQSIYSPRLQILQSMGTQINKVIRLLRVSSTNNKLKITRTISEYLCIAFTAVTLS